jgi:CMP-N,N'-diacetyllegionaminic acid synthase
MKSLAIIPARGGSKRLPKKNLQILGGKPLIAHTLDTVEESQCFTKALLSSDDPDILSMADNYDSVEAIVRTEELSGDKVTALTLVNSIVSQPQISENYDIIALLLPTAPFRKVQHLREAFQVLSKEIDGVVSLTQYEFPPQLSVKMENGFIEPVFDPCPLITGNTRSQDQYVIYRPNGAFYIQWMEKFLINQNFWKGKIKGYVMDRIDSVDIDDIADLEYAEYILRKR